MTESYLIRGVCSGCKKAGVIVSHLPKTSRVCSLFLLGGEGRGDILCTVSVRQSDSSDLVQGWLKMLCLLLFKGQPKEIAIVKSLKRNLTCS